MCDRFELEQYIGILRHFSKKIDETQECIEEVASDNPAARLAMTHIGIGYYAALMIAAEIGDVERFSSSEALVSFAGLAPLVR